MLLESLVIFVYMAGLTANSGQLKGLVDADKKSTNLLVLPQLREL